MKIRLILVLFFFLFVVYEVIRHSYLIVSTAAVLGWLVTLAALLAIFVILPRRKS
jgi:hypothetical protein